MCADVVTPYWQCGATNCKAVNAGAKAQCVACGSARPRSSAPRGGIGGRGEAVSFAGLERVHGELKSELETMRKVQTLAPTVVVLVGQTGAGKSTTVNYLAGVLYKKRGLNLVVSEGADKIVCKVGAGMSSKTMVPLPVVISHGTRELCIIDTAGTKDTRSANHTVVAANLFSELIAKIPHDISALCFTIQETELFAKRMALLDSLAKFYRLYLTSAAFSAGAALPNVRILYFITHTGSSTADVRIKLKYEAERYRSSGISDGMADDVLRNRLTVLDDMALHSYAIDPTNRHHRDVILRGLSGRESSNASAAATSPRSYIDKKWLIAPSDTTATAQVKSIWSKIAANSKMASASVSNALSAIKQHTRDMSDKTSTRQRADTRVRDIESAKRRMEAAEASAEEESRELIRTRVELKACESRLSRDKSDIIPQERIVKENDTNERIFEVSSVTSSKYENLWTSSKTEYFYTGWFDGYTSSESNCSGYVTSSCGSSGRIDTYMNPTSTGSSSFTVRPYRLKKNTDAAKGAIKRANAELARLRLQVSTGESNTRTLNSKVERLTREISEYQKTAADLRPAVRQLADARSSRSSATNAENEETTKGSRLRRSCSSTCALMVEDASEVYGMSYWFTRDPTVRTQFDDIDEHGKQFVNQHSDVQRHASVSSYSLDSFRERHVNFHRRHHVVSGKHRQSNGSTKVTFSMPNNHKEQVFNINALQSFESSMITFLKRHGGGGAASDIHAYTFKWAYRTVHFSSTPNELGMGREAYVVVAPRLA